jgi:hypothetical protein
LAGPLETQSKVNVPSVIRYLSANGATPVEIHCQLTIAMSSTCVTERGVDTGQCNSDTTQADDKLRPVSANKVIMNDNTCRADGLIQKGRTINLLAPEFF